MLLRRNLRRSRIYVPKLATEASDLTGMQGWYNFLAANVTKDGSNRISQVNDLSGNARHAVQATNNNKIVWTSASPDYGLLDAAAIPAFKRALKTGLGAIATFEWTIALVCKCITAPSAGNMFNLMGVENSATGKEGSGKLGYYSTTRTRRLFITPAVGSGAAVTFGDAPADTWERWIVRIAGTSVGGAATVSAWVDGVAQSVSGSTTTNDIAANAAYFLGCSIANGSCAIRDARIWYRALSDVSVTALDTLLQSV